MNRGLYITCCKIVKQVPRKFTSELWRLSQNREGVRKNLRTRNRERVRMMRENNKTRADSTLVDNFLGKCCPEQTHTQSLLRLFQRESDLERV